VTFLVQGEVKHIDPNKVISEEDFTYSG
jgi:hypothetical protein